MRYVDTMQQEGRKEKYFATLAMVSATTTDKRRWLPLGCGADTTKTLV